MKIEINPIPHGKWLHPCLILLKIHLGLLSKKEKKGSLHFEFSQSSMYQVCSYDQVRALNHT